MGENGGNLLLKELARERQARQRKDEIVTQSGAAHCTQGETEDDVLIIDSPTPSARGKPQNSKEPRSADEDYELALRLQREEEEAAAGDIMETASKWENTGLLSQLDGEGASLDSSWGDTALGGAGGGAYDDTPSLGHVDASASLTDDQVCPDAHQMFLYYDKVYFGGMLTQKAVVVEWSKRMTLCAGQCSYRGQGSMCRIALSAPLLSFRSATEVKDTLLHEMIHAWQFVSSGNRDREDHGPIFASKMREINAGLVPDMYRPAQGYGVSVYHTFSDEVQFHRQHWWQCSRCKNIVKRAMNRAPSAKDCREYRTDPAKMRPCADPRCSWHSHSSKCGGEYSKIRGPGKPSGKSTDADKASKKGESVFGGAKVGVGAVVGKGELEERGRERGREGQAAKKLKGVGGKSITDFFKAGAAKQAHEGGKGAAEGKEGRAAEGKGKTPKGRFSVPPMFAGGKEKERPCGGESARASTQGKEEGKGGRGVPCPVCYATFESEEAVAMHLDSCLQGR